jgi:hypothetical protein
MRLRVSFADGAYGPGDLDPVLVENLGEVFGPELPNWRGAYMLVRCVTPVAFRGSLLELLIVAPRYSGVTLPSLRSDGGIAGVARVLPGSVLAAVQHFRPESVEDFAVASVTPEEV